MIKFNIFFELSLRGLYLVKTSSILNLFLIILDFNLKSYLKWSELILIFLSESVL